MIEQPPSLATQPRGRVALLLSAALFSALLVLFAGRALALISSSAREAGDATSWYPGKEAKSWYPGKYAALTARTTSSLPTMPSRLESFNQCVSLQHAYFLKLAINDMLATTLWSDLDPGTADASIGLEPQAEPTEITGPPVGKACALACAGEIGGDLRSDWPGAIWSLGGWIGAGNLTALGSSLGSALGGSRCREVHTVHSLGGSILGVKGLEVARLEIDAGRPCNPAAATFNVSGSVLFAVGGGALDVGSALEHAIDEVLWRNGPRRRGGGKLEVRSAVSSHSVCEIEGERRHNASTEVGPLTLLAQLYNVTLSARFSMTIAACSVTRIAMSEVSVGWEAATIGHRSGGDFSVNGAPFDSVRLGRHGSDGGDDDDDGGDDDDADDDDDDIGGEDGEGGGGEDDRRSVRLCSECETLILLVIGGEGGWWSSVQALNPGAAMLGLDEMLIRPQIDASAQAALNQILSETLPQPLCNLAPASVHEYAGQLATSSSGAAAVAGAGLVNGAKASFGSASAGLSKAGAGVSSFVDDIV